MRLTGVLLAHELRTQLRSTRFKAAGAIYVVLCLAPSVLMFAIRRRLDYTLTAATYAWAAEILQPALTAFVAMLLATDGVSRERDDGSLRVVSLASFSNCGYVLRRWLSILVLLLPVTLLPQVGAFLLAVASGAAADPARFFLPWLLHIVPIAAASSAAFLALGTIAGEGFALFLAGAIYVLVLGYGNDALVHFHRTLAGPSALLSVDGRDVGNLLWVARGYWDPHIETDAPVDPGSILHPLVASVLWLSIALALLLSAGAYVRRTRPDVKPWKIDPSHSLATMLRFLNRVRQAATPDAGLQRSDRLAVAIAIGTLIAGIGWTFSRQSEFARLASERYEAELSKKPEPTPAALVPVEWSVAGNVSESGEVFTTATLVFENRGTAPVAHLAFSINPMLEVRGDGMHVVKHWDRVAVDLPAPVAPGARRALRFAVSGIPSEVSFPLVRTGSFLDAYKQQLEGRMAPEVADLSQSSVTRAVSPSAIRLGASDLAPVPRFSRWDIEDKPFFGRRIVDERITPSVQIGIDLALPHGTVVGDSCSSLSSNGRLTTRCSMSLMDFGIRGGRLSRLPLSPELTALVMPAHARAALPQGLVLARAVTLSRSAWPGLDLPPRLILVEEPAAATRSWYRERSFRNDGGLLVADEDVLLYHKPLDTAPLAARIASAVLLRKRDIATDQQDCVRSFIRTVLERRLFESRAHSAVDRSPVSPLAEPLLRSGDGRMDAVVADLEYRIGADRIADGLSDFLDAKPAAAGTARELLDAIGRRAGVSLETTYHDYFESDAVAKLALEDVKFEKRGDEWLVSGSVVNSGTAHPACPVVLRTEFQPMTTLVNPGPKEKKEFSFRTKDHPRAIELDPQGVCYRWAPVGTVERVEAGAIR